MENAETQSTSESLGGRAGQVEKGASSFGQMALECIVKNRFTFGIDGGFRPTKRDLEVFKFIAEMKFGFAPILFERFFSELKDGETRQNDSYVRRRLCRWTELGLLEPAYTTYNDQAIYFLTKRGQQLLKMLNLTIEYFATQRTYDPRLFDHDMKVMIARLALEKSGRAFRWISERSVKSEVTIFNGLARKYIPDGLYRNKNGELVAFEMEISKKSKARYQEKIDKYVVLIKTHRAPPARFARALFICQSRSVFEIISAMTRFHGDIFKVEMFHELIAEQSQAIPPVQIPILFQQTGGLNGSV